MTTFFCSVKSLAMPSKVVKMHQGSLSFSTVPLKGSQVSALQEASHEGIRE